jgi:hypothetical protein
VPSSVYYQRLFWLESLPACFTLAEFRRVSGLSRDAAWQTLRQWEQASRLASVGGALYRRPEIPLRLPLEVHRAAVLGGASGYITGRAALTLARRRRSPIDGLDLVIDRRTGASAPEPPGGLRRHCLRLVRFQDGLTILFDGGRRIRVATPERVVVDALAFPGRFLEISEIVEMLRRNHRRLATTGLLDLAARLGSESVRRRLAVVAAAAGRKRLARWARELGPYSVRMGRILLDPSAPVPVGSPVAGGVIVNVPLGK